MSYLLMVPQFPPQFKEIVVFIKNQLQLLHNIHKLHFQDTQIAFKTKFTDRLGLDIKNRNVYHNVYLFQSSIRLYFLVSYSMHTTAC